MDKEYADGQNPIYLIRTLPEQMYRPDGTSAFGSRSGGLLGVFGGQMKDVNEFGRAWADGAAPSM